MEETIDFAEVIPDVWSSTRVNFFDDLDTQLLTENLVTKEEGGRGDCFYLCMAIALGRPGQMLQVRNEIADWIVDNWSEDFLTQANGCHNAEPPKYTKDSFVQSVRQPGADAEPPSVHAASQKYLRSIRMYMPAGFFMTIGENFTGEPILLASSGGHVRRVVPLGEQPPRRVSPRHPVPLNRDRVVTRSVAAAGEGADRRGFDAGIQNRLLFGYIGDTDGQDNQTEEEKQISEILQKSGERLQTPLGATDVVNVDDWVVCMVVSPGYHVGQVARVAAKDNRKLRLDFGVAWGWQEGYLPFVIQKAEFERMFRRIDIGVCDKLLLPADATTPLAARTAMWSVYRCRVGRRVCDYNVTLEARTWANYNKEDLTNNLTARLFLVTAPVRNLQHARLELGIAHDAMGSVQDDSYKRWNSSMYNSIKAGYKMYPMELRHACAMTSSSLADALRTDDDTRQADIMLLDTDATLRSAGGLFPISVSGNLTHVKLGNIAGQDAHWNNGSIKTGGWTFSMLRYTSETDDTLVMMTKEGDDQTIFQRKAARELVQETWKPLHPERDYLARLVGDHRFEEWTLAGTRAHAKCFAADIAVSSKKCVQGDHVQYFKDTVNVMQDGEDVGDVHYGIDNVDVDKYTMSAFPVYLPADAARLKTDPQSRFILPPALRVPGSVVSSADVQAAYNRLRQKFVCIEKDVLLVAGKQCLHRQELCEVYDPAVNNSRFFDVGSDKRHVHEHFAKSLQDTLEAYVRINWKQLCGDVAAGVTYRLQKLAVEYPVYWPFGTHSHKANSLLTLPYETRIDAVVQIQLSDGYGAFGENPRGPVLVVEYKCRMENETGNSLIWTAQTAKKHMADIVTLSGTSERRQAELNSWMLYLCTGRLPTHALVIQGTRRLHRRVVAGLLDDASNAFWEPRMRYDHAQDPHANAAWMGGHDDTSACGYVACLKLDWKSEYMRKLILQFCKAPYGTDTHALYADTLVMVPLLSQLQQLLPGHEWIPGSEFEIALANAAAMADTLCRSRVFSAPRIPHTVVVPTDVATGTNNQSSVLPPPMQVARISRNTVTNIEIGMESLATLYCGQTAPWKKVHPVQTAAVQKAYRESINAQVAMHMWMSVSPDYIDYFPLLYLYGVENGRHHVQVVLYLNSDAKITVADPRPLGSQVRLSAGIFRRTELAGLTFSCWKTCQNEPDACRDLRHELYDEVQHAAARIITALETQFRDKMRRITVEQFWMISTNNIYRRNLTPYGPVMREFNHYPAAGLPTEPYNQVPDCMDFRWAAQPAGPQPPLTAAQQNKRNNNIQRIANKQATVDNLTQQELRAQRKASLVECVERCIHRLVNTRLMRGALAMAGVTTSEHTDALDLTPDDAMWLVNESAAAGPVQAGLDETAAWWQTAVRSTRRTWVGDKEHHERRACFPHMSRRTAWSQQALEAAVQGAGSVLRVAERHVLEDLTIAMTDYA
jgi:hypothetical protein